jgi:protein-L-isoaspartate(D-aspartate) O-methyltransferase
MKKDKQWLIDYWRSHKIIIDDAVFRAFELVSREEFVQYHLKTHAYDDHALPLEEGQTISQPTTVVLMTQALVLKEAMTVLEVGTGSGYQSALLSVLVGEKGHVWTTEIVPALHAYATKRLQHYKNVTVMKVDGGYGLKDQAPFDRILITAGCHTIPQPLIDQLKQGGVIVAPVGGKTVQNVLVGVKKGKLLRTHTIGDFAFVPLQGEYGW